jgi:dihydrodipicolinate synthase/N-acetylneuraminate lyase
MTTEDLRRRLCGVIAFPITPFHDDFSLNLPGLRENLRALLKYPIAAIVAAGGTGEMYSLTPSEHGQVVKTIVEESAGRVPVISGTGFNRQIAIELAQQSASLGADAILALPPYYPNADEDGLAAYYAAIGSATPLPLFLYSRDWVNPTPAWAEKLAADVPTLFAWKDGQGDTRRYQQIISRLGDRLYWIGGGRRSAALAAHARLRHSAVCPARPTQGIRGLGDEGNDESAGHGRGPGASATAAGCPRGQARYTNTAGDMEADVVLNLRAVAVTTSDSSVC